MKCAVTPKVSIIIPLYNKAPYIKRALDSVLAQTIQNFEVIVVNDGSQDGGEMIVEKYSDSRIHLINQENRGVSIARNSGVNAARADLVAFLDADDEWLPEFLEEIIALNIKYPNAGMYFSNSWKIRGEESYCSRPINPEDDGLITNYFRECALRGHRIDTITVAVKKSIFLSLNGFNSEFKIYEDYDLWDRIAYNYPIAYTSKPLAIYHMEVSCTVERIKTSPKKVKLPFIDYLYSNQKESVCSRDDYADIMLYLDSLAFLDADINSRYHRLTAMKNLLKIHSKELFWKKQRALIICLLPNSIKPTLAMIERKLKRHMMNLKSN